MELDPVVDVFGTRLSQFNGFDERLLRDDGERFWSLKLTSRAAGEPPSIHGMKLERGDEKYINERSTWLPLALRLDVARTEIAGKREALPPPTEEEKQLEASLRTTLGEALGRWVEVLGLEPTDDFRARAPSWIGVHATSLARAQTTAQVPGEIVTFIARSDAQQFVVHGMFSGVFGKVATPYLRCFRAFTPFQHEWRKEREAFLPADGKGGYRTQMRLTEAMSLPRTGELTEADRVAVNALIMRLGLYVSSWRSQMPLTTEGEQLMGEKISELAGEIVLANRIADVPAPLCANEGKHLLHSWFTEPKTFKALTGLAASEVHKVREERKPRASVLIHTVDEVNGTEHVELAYPDVKAAEVAGGIRKGEEYDLRTRTIKAEPTPPAPKPEAPRAPAGGWGARGSSR